MRPLWSPHLLLLTFLSLTSLTSCHPRPRDDPATTPSSSIPSTSAHNGGHTGPSLARRGIGFRDFLDIGGGWNMYYSAWPAVALPVQPAAWALANLYASILVQARGKWTASPPRHSFTVTYGGIRILMHCPQKPIPWLFVGNFAEKLLQITEAGWTGVYLVMLSQPETDVSIRVQLTVVS
ncbi:hypothetical protein HO133_001137 [Letharia lupina]|uniref:Uncharacterized protein n=1 Tax=Letharia lupina TaxID=560253 RepID=A0A8H6FBH8_9LECA|nr:uncharacterized protein HO133_001137 [Letharia lupina]KAF6222051.1 hypothetical protein HO133_001137 [Letharia lupina]